MKLPWIIVLAGILSACSKPPLPAPPERQFDSSALETVVVRSEVVPLEITLDGVLEALSEATVSAQTTGRVEEINFDVGDFVPRNAVILTLTDKEQRGRTQAAEGALAEASARLAESRASHQRILDLFARKLVARAELDRAEAELNAAIARNDSAAAALAVANENLAYTVVRAPYAGTVVSRLVRQGEAVSPGQPLMRGLSLENLRAIVDVPQQQIAAVRAHTQASVLLGDDPVRAVPANSLRISPQASPSTHTFRVLVEIPEGDYGVFPGFLVKVAFVIGEQTHLVVPRSAVVKRGEITGAYVVEDSGRVNFRYLRTGPPVNADLLTVLTGLAAGDRLAADPIAAGVSYKYQTGQAAPGES